MVYDILIIGAGPAGMTAGIYARRANLKVAIIEKGAPGGQIITTTNVENYPGINHVSGADLAMKIYEHAEQFEVPFIFEEVLEVIPGEKIKVITDRNTYTSKTVLIATGSIPKRLGALNEEELAYKGISWCAICDGPFYKNQEIVVVGGGNSAVEEANYLTSIAKEVTVVHLGNLSADKKAQEILKKKSNVKFRPFSTIKEFIKNEEGELIGVKIINIKNNQEETIKTTGVFEYIGLMPVTQMVSKLGITNKAGYIVVNNSMKTKIPGIYAAGDVINKNIRQLVTATNDGAIAILNIVNYIEGL